MLGATCRVIRVEFLLRFTRYGHRAGYATADLEERVLSLAEALGLQGAEISATLTLVEISLGSIPHQRSYTLPRWVEDRPRR